jgi:two-component system cell cycle sensor histidine kinase/response regulator CckA
VTLKFTYVSQGAERLFGYSLEQWLTRPAFWVDLLHPEDREQAVELCRTAVNECRDHDFEYRALAADGRVLWIRDLVRVISDGHGHATALHGVMIDLTERRQAESALDRKDQYYRALIEHALDIITVVSRDGILQYESPSAERILGYPLSERLGRNVFDLLHADDLSRVRAVFEASMATGRPTTFMRFRYRHADGTWRVLEAIGRPFVNDEGQLVGIVNCRDVTERQQLEEQVRDAQKMEALGRLTSTIAHDFNNLLVVILGSVELAIQSEHSAGLRYDLGEIKRSAELGAGLTRQLLAFSRRTTGAPEIISLDASLLELKGILQRLVGHDVHVELALGAQTARVRLARGTLEQIIMNLAVNARDAMPKGGTLRVATANTPATVDIGSEEMAERVVIEVSDTGSGMPADIRARIFEPYFTTKDAGKGTGLGMSTVYRIVRDSGGHIDVDSEPGHGTRFRIHLPIVPGDPG